MASYLQESVNWHGTSARVKCQIVIRLSRSTPVEIWSMFGKLNNGGFSGFSSQHRGPTPATNTAFESQSVVKRVVQFRNFLVFVKGRIPMRLQLLAAHPLFVGPMVGARTAAGFCGGPGLSNPAGRSEVNRALNALCTEGGSHPGYLRLGLGHE